MAIFPEPMVPKFKRPFTKEQAWQGLTWPNYYNGVGLGGLFVIEDWMFYKSSPPYSVPNLQLKTNSNTDQLAWSEALLQEGSLEKAYATLDCHLRNFYSDRALDELAEFGINAVRIAVGYWAFDDPELYPGDPWIHPPSNMGEFGNYGVNPDGFITPGTGLLTDLVVKLWNRNMKVVLDMHALPGCSTPHQSYAGMDCEDKAPNFWAGAAADGVSGGHRVQRDSSDPKTWAQIYGRITLERVVPWIKFIEEEMPGAILGYELLNEPDLNAGDASADEVRDASVGLGALVTSCLGPELASYIFVGVSYASQNYKTTDMAQDYNGLYGEYKDHFYTDIHHYYAWAGCLDEGSKTFSLQCSCESNTLGSQHENEDGDWAGFMKVGVFQAGWRFYVGEWSAHNGPATACQNNLPTIDQARALWRSQKFNYLTQYMQYSSRAPNGLSSFVGDFYWNGRMGYNWNADPAVCAPDTSTEHYADYSSWDWSLLRLIELGIAQPLSQLDWTPSTLADHKASTCSGDLQVHCDQREMLAVRSTEPQIFVSTAGGETEASSVLSSDFGHKLRMPLLGIPSRFATAVAASLMVLLVVVLFVPIARRQDLAPEANATRRGVSEEQHLLDDPQDKILATE